MARIGSILGLAVMLLSLPGQAAVIIRHGQEEGVTLVREADGQLWAITTRGELFRVGSQELQRKSPAGDSRPLVLDIAEVSGRIWLGTARGIWELRGDRYHQLSLAPETDNSQIGFLVPDLSKGRLWLGTTRSVVLVDPEGKRPPQVFPLQGREITRLTLLSRGVVAGARDNLYLYDEAAEGFTPLAVEGGPIEGTTTIVESAGGDLFVVTDPNAGGHLYRIQGRQAVPIVDDHLVAGIGVGEDGLWYSVDERRHELGYQVRWGRGDNLEYLDVFWHLDSVADAVFVKDGHVWVGTLHGVYRLAIADDEKGFQVVARLPAVLGINGFLHSSQGEFWAWGTTGLYRIYEDIDLDVKLNTATIGGMPILWGEELKIERGLYRQGGQVEPDMTSAFTGILELDRENFQKRMKEGHFLPLDKTVTRVPWSVEPLAAVRDSYGNIGRYSGPNVRSVTRIRSLALWGAAILFLIAIGWRRALTLGLGLFLSALKLNPADLVDSRTSVRLVRWLYIREAGLRNRPDSGAWTWSGSQLAEVLEQIENDREAFVVVDDGKADHFLARVAYEIAHAERSRKLGRRLPVTVDLTRLPRNPEPELIPQKIESKLSNASRYLSSPILSRFLKTGMVVILFRIGSKHREMLEDIAWYLVLRSEPNGRAQGVSFHPLWQSFAFFPPPSAPPTLAARRSGQGRAATSLRGVKRRRVALTAPSTATQSIRRGGGLPSMVKRARPLGMHRNIWR